jgi:hypothetical protein
VIHSISVFFLSHYFLLIIYLFQMANLVSSSSLITHVIVYVIEITIIILLAKLIEFLLYYYDTISRPYHHTLDFSVLFLLTRLLFNHPFFLIFYTDQLMFLLFGHFFSLFFSYDSYLGYIFFLMEIGIVLYIINDNLNLT